MERNKKNKKNIVVLSHGRNKEKHVFTLLASQGQIEVCSICPFFACFQPPKNDRHQNNLY